MSYREVILETAKTLFARKGFSNVSVAEIAAIAGAAEGTIFHHFHTKEELYIAVFKRIHDDILHTLAHDLQTTPYRHGLAMVEGTALLLFRLAEEMPDEFRLLSQSYPHKLAEVNPTCHQLLESLYDAFISALAKGIRTGIEDGSIDDLQPERQALVILSLINGVVRFRDLNLWPTTRGYLEALSFCIRALEKR